MKNIKLVALDYKHKDKKGYLGFYTSEKDLIENIVAHQNNITIKQTIQILKEVSKFELNTSNMLLIENEDDYNVYLKVGGYITSKKNNQL